MTAAGIDTPQGRVSSWTLTQLEIVYHQLWQLRLFKDPTFRDIAEHINPDMSDWFLRSDPELSGHAPNTGIPRYDTTAEESSNLCADGIMGYAISRDSAWFRFEFEDERANEQNNAYLQLCERWLYKQLSQSAFYDEERLSVRALLDLGTALMWKRENVAEGKPSYKTLHLGRSYIDEDQFGDVDTLMRDIWLTPQAAVEEFGYDSLPPQIQANYDLNNTKRWKFIQMTFPRDKYNLDYDQPKDWTDIIVADCERVMHPVRLKGYESKPFYASRYARSYDAGPWGSSAPGMLQLANIKQLNAITKNTYRIYERMGNPPGKASQSLRGRIVRTPGGFTYLDAGEDFAFMREQGDPKVMEWMVADLQGKIKRAYHEDFFLVLTNNIEQITKSTATGVQGLMGEKAALLSSFFSRLQYENLEPIIRDLYYSEVAAGRLPPPPRGSAGRPVKIVFVSPLFQMQRQALNLSQTKAALVEISQVAQMQIAVGQPADVLDNFDLSSYVRDIAKTYGMQADVVRNLIDVAKIRQARAQQAAQQAAMQQKELESRMNLERAKSVAAVTQATGSSPLAGGAAAEQAARAGGIGMSAPTAA